jgi:platelet-activating factor acetylhydrolase
MLAGREGGIALETCLLTMFYPSDPSTVRKRNAIWFPRLSQTVDGFLRMARRVNWLYRLVARPIAAAAIFGTTFPAERDGPFMAPADTDKKWPVAIVSHGVGCSRLMYSAFCGEMASRGYIVLAIEHRDGKLRRNWVFGV